LWLIIKGYDYLYLMCGEQIIVDISTKAIAAMQIEYSDA
jgi:hypothetical protein